LFIFLETDWDEPQYATYSIKQPLIA
jgi:hypothetical protein